jgi:hypothetical protein
MSFMKTEKHWMKEGTKVKNRECPEFTMTVDKILYKTVERSDKTFKKYTMGVQCHWMDRDGKYHQGRFHTNELVPAGN